MFKDFLLLCRHKNIALKRSPDFKKTFIIVIVSCISFALFLAVVSVVFTREYLMKFAYYALPILVLIDIFLRFFFKKNSSIAIFTYLTLPIQRKLLIIYIVLADLLRLWVWYCWLIYLVILFLCGSLTVLNAIILLLLILLNNYLTAFIKTLLGGYAVLAYPLCLGFVCFTLFAIYFLNPFFAVAILLIIVISLSIALFYTLKENLLDELNRFAL